MKRLENATPKYVDDTDFGLGREVPNAQFLAKLEAKPSKKKVGTVHLANKKKLPVFESGGNEDNGYYWVANEGRLVWLVKFKRIKNSWLPMHAVTQVMLWRDDDEILAANFTSKMFFDFVLAKHAAVISDKEQTEAGERFWKRRLVEAMQKQLAVAFVDFNRQTVDQIESLDELRDVFKVAWGPDKKHIGFRWMIWKP